MKLLHIDSSVLASSSASRELTAAIVAAVRHEVPALQVQYRDLDATPLPHLSARALASPSPAGTGPGDGVLREFLDADVVVVGAPMYNFTIPSTLKAWVDRIAVAGETFRYTADGAQGLVAGKRIIVASTRGGMHAGQPSDFHEPYLRFVFGFLGVTDVEFVRAEGLGISPQHRAQAMAAALASIPESFPRAA